MTLTPYTNKAPAINNATAVRLDVRREGSRFIGDLVFSDQTIWKAWQSSFTLGALKRNARCTFAGPIVRRIGDDI